MPKRDMSYRLAAVAMNSMPQHERPSGSGHTLFLRHQLIIDGSVERRNPPSAEPVAETRSVVFPDVGAAGTGVAGAAVGVIGGLRGDIGPIPYDTPRRARPDSEDVRLSSPRGS